MIDLTDAPIVRRMCVARGMLTGAPEQLDLTRLELAAQLGAKQATHLPDVHPCNLTHVQLDIRDVADDVEVTVTVQAFHRASLAPFALAGVTSVFLALPGATLRDCYVVQEV